MSLSLPSLLAIIDSVDAPLIALDKSGVVQFLNDRAEQWLARSRKRVLGQSLGTSEPWGPKLKPLVERVLATGMAVHEEVQVGRDAVTVGASPWWEADSQRGVVLWAQLRDVLIPAQERSDVAALAAGLAHEVRNPLAALRGAAELLAIELSPAQAGTLREYVALILRETARVDALVARLLAVARPLDLKRNWFRGDELIHDLARQTEALARARGLQATIEEEYDPALPPLFADRDRLFEALVNLAKNAVEALPPSGGRIVLAAGVDPMRRRTARGSQGLVSLSVSDSGPGLAASHDHLFTPFFTTKPSGTGLGLLMARRSVEAHGGVLVLRDRLPPDSGAEAQVLLPIETNHG